MFFFVFDILFSEKDIFYRVQKLSRQKYPNKFSYIWHLTLKTNWYIEVIVNVYIIYYHTFYLSVFSRKSAPESIMSSTVLPSSQELSTSKEKSYYFKAGKLINRVGLRMSWRYEVPGKDRHKYLNLIATMRITRHSAKFSCILLFLNIVILQNKTKNKFHIILQYVHL